MKKTTLITLLFAVAACSSKNTHNDANANAITVSIKGIGDLKIGMKKENVEKLLKHKLVLPNLAPDSTNNYYDTAACTYKGVDYTLGFTRDLVEDSNYIIALTQVSSHSPLLKTPSGIGIGDDLCRIAGAYEDHRLEIVPGIDYKHGPPVRLKGKSEITLFNDENNNVIIFYMNNNKVEGMAVTLFEGD